jgi:hypothetical protein
MNLANGSILRNCWSDTQKAGEEALHRRDAFGERVNTAAAKIEAGCIRMTDETK